MAVAEVVFEVIALGLEGVVVFVLDLPAGATGGDDAGDIFIGDLEVGDEGILIELFAFLVG